MYKKTDFRIALLFRDKQIIQYGILSHVLTESWTLFISKFFKFQGALLGAKILRSTMYHLQTNWHAERINQTIIARLRHYVAELQKY